MDPIRYIRSALTASIVMAATLTAGCGATSHMVPAVVSSPPGAADSTLVPGGHVASVPPSVPQDSHGGRAGAGKGSPAAAGQLPVDWPPDLPVPRGTISGSTGVAGRWTVLIDAAGSAREVRESAIALYASAGFTAVSDSALSRGSRQITVVAENRDHSATRTNLVIGVTTR